MEEQRVPASKSPIWIVAIWSSRDDAKAKACFGFVAPSLSNGLHERSQQPQALKTVYEGIGWEVPHLAELIDANGVGFVLRQGDSDRHATMVARTSSSPSSAPMYSPIGGRFRQLSACICGIRERDRALCRSRSGAGTQILNDNESLGSSRNICAFRKAGRVIPPFGLGPV